MIRFRSMNVRPMQLLLGFLVAVIFAIALSACQTVPQLSSNPIAQAAVAAAIDVGVGEAVTKGGISPALLVEGAKELKAYDTGQSVTIPALQAEVQVLILKYNLNPGQAAAVQVLEATLNALIQTQLQASSSAPSSAPAAISADVVTTLNIVLDDVISAASLYQTGAAAPATTDVPPQNKHFVLASVESPPVVGAAASLVLVASLQAFAHVQVASPVAAAITVLFTVGAAAIDNLIGN